MLATPSPTLPRKRERERTEIAGRARVLAPPARSFPRKRESKNRSPWLWVPAFAGTNGWNHFRGRSGWNFFDYIATTLLTTYYAREAKSPLVEGVSGNDPKAERGVARNRHGGAPRGERVMHASHDARRV